MGARLGVVVAVAFVVATAAAPDARAQNAAPALLRVWGAAAPVRATPASREAHAAFVRGVALSERGLWAAAADAFAESWRAGRQPVALANLALAHRVLGLYAQSAEELREYLRDGAPGPELREAFAALLADNEAHVARLSVAVRPREARAVVSVDGRESVDAAPVTVDPGRHAVVVHAPVFQPSAAMVSLNERERRTLDVRLERDGGGVATKWWFWTTAGAVVASAALTSWALVGVFNHPSSADCGTLSVCLTPHQ